MNSQRDGIAIIGLSVRLPGASNQRQLWDILRRGDYMVGEIPRERWHVDKYFSAQKEAHKYYCKWGGFLSGINGFEPRLFQLSPKEAASMDPQQRLVLLNVWNLLEDAGYAARFMPRNTGVYIANNSHDYAHFDIDAFMHHSIASRNSDHYQIANRVSYHFDFKGPSITIDNACAGSGTALHLACQALRAGDCEVAIAGGVNLILHPSRFMMYCALQFVAPEPFVRPFDARARGTLFAEGVTSVLLKPLRAAEADGDHIYGVVLGTAINAGGQVRGFTVPNPMQQAAVVGKAIAAAGIDAADIGYIEAHGTGTAIGDPLEIRGLTRAFGEHSTDTELQACAVGTIKSNIGHCESAAAIAGLSKILLQMKHATLVPSINIEQLNPALKLARTPFRIQQALEAWPERAGARYAGLSSFGAGGSNAHIVIRSYHAPSLPAPTNQPTLLLLSAHSESQLQRYLHDLVEALTAEPAALADIAHTLTFGRETLNLRLVVIADSTAQLIDSLRTRAAGQPSPRIFPQAAADQLRTPGDAIPAPIRAAAAHWLNTGETDETLLQYYTQGRKISLPGLPFDALKAYGLDNYLRFEKPLADHQNFIRSQTISPDSPLFTQHIVDQREVLPGAVLPCLVQRHLHDVSPDTLWALRVDWEAPIESELQETTLEFAYQRDGHAYRIDVTEKSRGQRVARLTADPLADLEDASEQTEQSAALAALSGDDIYHAFAVRGMAYGQLFRKIASSRHAPTENIASYLPDDPASTWETASARLDAVLQSYLPLVLGPSLTRALVPTAAGCITLAGDWVTFDTVRTIRKDHSAGRQVFDLRLYRGDRLVGRIDDLVLKASALKLARDARLATVACEMCEVEPEGTIARTVLWLSTSENGDGWLSWSEATLVAAMRASKPAEAFALHLVTTPVGTDAGQIAAAITHQCLLLRAVLRESAAHAIALHCYLTDPQTAAATQLRAALETLGRTLKRELPQRDFDLYCHNAAGLTPRQVRQRVESGEGGFAKFTTSTFSLAPAGLDETWINYGQDDVALISGGAGQLGRLVARFLLERGMAQVYLLGRRPPDADLDKYLAAHAPRLHYLQCDLLDPAALQKAVADIQRVHDKITLAIHCAGASHDGAFLDKDRAAYQSVLDAKYVSLANFDTALATAGTGQLIIFSSLASTLGSIGQADYAVANALIEAYALHASTPATSVIQWPLWKEGGMGTNLAVRRFVHDHYGLAPLPTAVGLKALNHVLRTRPARISFAYGVADEISAHLNVACVPRVKTERTQAQVDPSRLDQVVKEQIARLLEIAIEDISNTDTFEALGFDSISLIDFGIAIGTAIGEKIPQDWALAELDVGTFTQKFRQYLQDLQGTPDPVATATAQATAQVTKGVYKAGKALLPYQYHHAGDDLPLVVLFPGILMRTGSWAFLYEDPNITAHCNLLVFEHEGQFNANKLNQPDDVFSIEQNVDHLRAILAKLALTDRPHYLMGISSGCVLQAVYAEKFPHAVLGSLMFAPLFVTGRRIQLNAETYSLLGEAVDEKALEYFLNMFYFDYFSDDFLTQKENTVSFMRSNVRKLSQEDSTIARSLSCLLKSYIRFGQDFDAWARRYAGKGIPTRIVVSENDRLINADNALADAEKLGAGAHVVKGAGHVMFVENEPYFKTSFLDWLNGKYGNERRSEASDRIPVSIPCTITIPRLGQQHAAQAIDISRDNAGLSLCIETEQALLITEPISVHMHLPGQQLMQGKVCWSQSGMNRTTFGLGELLPISQHSNIEDIEPRLRDGLPSSLPAA